MRQVCLLAEQVYSSWLRTFTEKSMRRFSRSATLSPWTVSEIRPTNWSQPILQSAHLSTGRSSIDPKEFRQRKVDMEYLRRENETVEQRNARTLRQYAYTHIVRLPVDAMRKDRISEQEVIAFRRAANQVLNLFAPSKKGLEFETATERPAAVRAAERERREKLLADKSNRSAQKALELESRRDTFAQSVAKRRKLQHEYVEEPVVDAGSSKGMGPVDCGGDDKEKKGRATTLVLPFWGCLAKFADELTEDFNFRPREQFDRTLPAPEKGNGVWEH